jgi:ABC-type amino acid transport system permease subunit
MGNIIEWISSITESFTNNLIAYISEMLRTTIQSIDRGQTEAGLALGFTQRQTFFKMLQSLVQQKRTKVSANR